MKTFSGKHMLVALCLLMAMVALAGCNADEQPDVTETDAMEFVYVAEHITLPRDKHGIRNLASNGDKVYFSAMTLEVPGDRYYNMHTGIETIYSINPDGTGFAELPNYEPPVECPADAEAWHEVHQIALDDDGNIWVAEPWEIAALNLPADYDPVIHNPVDYLEFIDNGYVIRKLDPLGAPLSVIDIAGIEGLEVSDFHGPTQYLLAMYGRIEPLGVSTLVTSMTVTSDGNICVAFANYSSYTTSVFVLDDTGRVLFRDEVTGLEANFVRMSSGGIAVKPLLGGLHPIDMSNGVIGAPIEIAQEDSLDAAGVRSAATLELRSGGGQFDILAYNRETIVGVGVENGEVTRLLDWYESDINGGNIRDIIALSDRRIACLSIRQIIAVEKATLTILTKIPRSELPSKTVITLAGLGIDSAAIDAVNDFNMTNHAYRVEIKDYLQSDITYDDDRRRLILDITTGNGPDILEVSKAPYADFVATGAFCDLYPYIDADPVFSRSDFVQGALRAAENGGRLYKAFSAFSVQTIVGNPAVLGEGAGWNLGELESALNRNPDADIPMGAGVSGSDFIANAVLAGDFINWETGTASFDSPQFVQLLELASRLQNSVTADRLYAIRGGRQIMEYGTYSDFHFYLACRAAFGEDFVFKGFPNESRNGHLLTPNSISFSILDTSENKEAAWSFVRTILDKDWQLDNAAYASFLLNQEAFDLTAKALTEPRFTHSNSPDGTITDHSIDTEYYFRIIELINSAPAVMGFDVVLLGIIMESAEDYLSGQISAEEAAKIIQSRVSIYLSERN